MKKAKRAAKSIERNLSGTVYYYPVVGRFVILSQDYPNDGCYDRTVIMRDQFKPKTATVIGSYDRILREMNQNPFVVRLGVVQRASHFVINSMGEHRKLRRAQIADLMDLLEENVERIQTEGPAKVKAYDHRFRYRDHEFEVESYLNRKNFLIECPEFKKFKATETRVSEDWVGRKKLKPTMTLVKTKVL